MLNVCSFEDDGIARYLEETYVPISQVRHSNSNALLNFWKKRPADGIVVGRDLPSRQIAKLLSHLILWSPIDGGKDYLVRHMGETLRGRFGDYVVGKKMSKLFSPSFFAYHQDADYRIVVEDRAELLDIVQSYNGANYLHYEVVMFPVCSPDRMEKWIAAGAFYF